MRWRRTEGAEAWRGGGIFFILFKLSLTRRPEVKKIIQVLAYFILKEERCQSE
jgi:hypothetical protein